jgi:hypothetical protein
MRRYQDPVDSIAKQPSGVRLAGLAAVLLLCFSAAASGAPVAYSVSYGNLLAIDVETGDFETIGPTGLNVVPALTLAPTGRLLGVSWVDGEYQLVVFDQETGSASSVGPLGIDGEPTGLAADFRTRLWLTTADSVYLVDSGSGAATLWMLLDRRVTSLSAAGNRLYLFTDDPEQGRWLEVVDIETGDGKQLFDLDELQLAIIGSSFDAEGTLWFLGQGGGFLNVVPLGFFNIRDLTRGEIEETFFEVYFFGRPEADMQNMALPPQWRKALPVRH